MEESSGEHKTPPKVTVPKVTVPKVTVPKVTVPKVTVTKAIMRKEPLKTMTKEPVKKGSDSTWIRSTPVPISALWTNTRQTPCDKSAREVETKHTYEYCNHTWVVRSHPTIPYSGPFCSKCDMEKH